jgi:hypothetical protein
MQLALRLPYDVKAMTVAYTTLDGAPFIPPYGDIHHRSETLRGISDPSVDVQWSPSPSWIAGIGTTLPFGHTVPDPIALGRAGLTHEHMQFGSGTFQPRLTVQWAQPFRRVTLAANADATLSLYENGKGFRAPRTILWSFGPSLPLPAGMFASLRVQGQRQSVGLWHGERDEGDGFDNTGVRLQLALPPLRGVVFAPAVYRELRSVGTGDETFRQGTTWSVSMQRTF